MPTLAPSISASRSLAGALAVWTLASLAGCDERAAAIAPAAASAELTLPSGPVANAYGHALGNLRREHWEDVRTGKGIFTATWVPFGAAEAEQRARGPAAQVREGLGPLFNATSCQGCHFKDGRGRPPPEPRRPAGTPETHDAGYLPPVGPPRLVRVGLLGAQGELLADPALGSQLQDRALQGHRAEGGFIVETARRAGAYGDGTAYVLEEARPALRGVAPLPGRKLSLRLPPSLIGLGLLEAIPEATLAAKADPDDRDGDGVSGRVARVASGPRSVGGASGALAVGRFGWKASQPSLHAQNAAALREDLGVTTSVYPARGDEAGALGEAGAGGALGGLPPPAELSDADLEQLTRYVRLLEPPARRELTDPQVRRGEALFAGFGCAACHTPSVQTGEVADLPELSRRTIEPFTDLLLHDLGDDLADDRPEGGATGREWRTAPLWGLGLLGHISGEVRLLHDGRARSIEEAILWHGGEGQAAREKFRRAAATERAALLRFLGSL